MGPKQPFVQVRTATLHQCNGDWASKGVRGVCSSLELWKYFPPGLARR